MLSTGGNGGTFVKYAEKDTVQIGTGNSARVTVTNDTTTVSNNLTVSGDLNATGGNIQSYMFFRNNFKQGATTAPHMTASMMSASNGTTDNLSFIYLRIPMRKSGSIVGLSVYAGNDGGIVKSGSLTASITINGATKVGATLGMHTGTVAVASFDKDTYTFNPKDLLGVQLTSSATYLSEPDVTSASFVAIVDVEY